MDISQFFRTFATDFKTTNKTMNYYILTLTATRENQTECISPKLSEYGETENMVSETIGLFDNKENAIKSFYEYYEKENKRHGNNTMIKTYQKGDRINGQIVTIENDECGNTWTTMVNLKTMEVKEIIDIEEEVFANYM